MPIIERGSIQRLFSASDILSNLYPTPFPLILPTDPRSIVVPDGLVVAEYQVLPSGVVAFGATPKLQLGYATLLTAWGNDDVGLTATVSKVLPLTGGAFSIQSLTDIVNHPLVVSLADGLVADGPVKTSSLNDGGADWAANDTFEIDGSTNAVGKVLTVAAITGVVLTYTFTNLGVVTAGAAQDAINASGIGTGLKINIDAVTQGNGSLYLEFDWKRIRLPQYAKYPPVWPIQ